MGHRSFKEYIIAVPFIMILFFPMINGRFKLVKDIEGFENRAMDTMPRFDVENLDQYPGRYEKYYNDNFTIRSTIVKYYNRTYILAFRKSPIPDKVIIGMNSWLFGTGKELDAYMGRDSLSNDELNKFKLELEYRKKYINAMGSRFYFVVVPAKADIYGDELPSNIVRLNNRSWGEQLIAYLDKNSDIKPVNVFNVLRKNRGPDPLYYKLDIHWNQLGGFYAANEILKCIQSDRPEISPLSIKDYNVVQTKTDAGDLSNMFGNNDLFNDGKIELIPRSGFKATEIKVGLYVPTEGFEYYYEYEKNREIEGSGKPRIMVISDSFGKDVFPFLAEEFSKSIKIFDAWQYKLNEEILKNEKPDVVVLIAWEPYMKGILDHPAGLNAR